MITPQDLIKRFTSEATTLDFSPNQIAETLFVCIQKNEYDLFNRVLDAYLDFFSKCAAREHADPRGGLKNIACSTTYIDHKKGFYRPLKEEQDFKETYRNPERYGPTMKAFASYFGTDSFSLIQGIWGKSEEE